MPKAGTISGSSAPDAIEAENAIVIIPKGGIVSPTGIVRFMVRGGAGGSVVMTQKRPDITTSKHARTLQYIRIEHFTIVVPSLYWAQSYCVEYDLI